MAAQVVNLTFHGTGPVSGRALGDGERDVWLATDELATALDLAATRDDVRITFDDGNASDLEQALPALVARGLSATFFVVVGRLGTPGFLDVDGLRALEAAGMTVGSHGMEHRRWRGLGAPELTRELVAAKAELENALGHPVEEAACPFGSYDRGVLHALRRAGFRRVHTSDRGRARPDAWLQPRNTLRRGRAATVIDDALALGRPPRSLSHRAKLALKRLR